MSSVTRQFHASKGVLASLSRPTIPCNFVRTFCYLRRMCVQHFMSHATSSTSVSSVNCTANNSPTGRLLHSPSHLLSVPHNLYRIPSRRQCFHRRTNSMHEYARHSLHYLCTVTASRQLTPQQ